MNKLLAEQFPARNGLQDPQALKEIRRYNPATNQFVQIINIARNHWVCVSNVLSAHGIVEVYNSMPSYSVEQVWFQEGTFSFLVSL